VLARLLGQEIVCRAINDGAEMSRSGVHRGLSVDGCFSTADFGLSALKSLDRCGQSLHALRDLRPENDQNNDCHEPALIAELREAADLPISG